MSRSEFISALEKELRKLPVEEREAAIEFFEEYFDDVLSNTDKTEKEVIEEVGSPKKIAAEIKADYAARILEEDEEDGGKTTGRGQRVSAVWWIIIGICAAPLSIALAAVVFCTLICVILAVAVVYLALAVVGVSAVAAFVFGIITLFTSAATGLMFMGTGILLAAIFLACGAALISGTKMLFGYIKRKASEKQRSRQKNKLIKMYSEGKSEEVL